MQEMNQLLYSALYFKGADLSQLSTAIDFTLKVHIYNHSDLYIRPNVSIGFKYLLNFFF